MFTLENHLIILVYYSILLKSRIGDGMMSNAQKPQRVALYARVSTLLNQTPEHQLIHLREVAKSRGFIVIEEFVDHGISGARESRPALNRLMKAALERRFDIVMIAALDRIGRNTRHVLRIMDDFKSYGINLVSLR